MLSIKKLEVFGADVRSAMEKCRNDEAFYLHLVELFLQKNDYLAIKRAINRKDLQRAYECSLNMKGVSGNLSLMPIYVLTAQLTRHLYNREDINYSLYLDRIHEQLKILKSL